MSTDLIVAEEDEVLDDVAMAMIRNGVSRIPVVRDDMLVGILTQSDIYVHGLDSQRLSEKNRKWMLRQHLELRKPAVTVRAVRTIRKNLERKTACSYVRSVASSLSFSTYTFYPRTENSRVWI